MFFLRFLTGNNIAACILSIILALMRCTFMPCRSFSYFYLSSSITSQREFYIILTTLKTLTDTVAYKNSFYVRAPSVWNTLPKDLRDTTRSVSSFKTNLCQFYNKLLDDIFDPEDSRTYKTVCIKCHSTRSLLTLSTFSCC